MVQHYDVSNCLALASHLLSICIPMQRPETLHDLAFIEFMILSRIPMPNLGQHHAHRESCLGGLTSLA